MPNIIDCLNLCNNLTVVEDSTQTLGFYIQVLNGFNYNILEFVCLVLNDFGVQNELKE